MTSSFPHSWTRVFPQLNATVITGFNPLYANSYGSHFGPNVVAESGSAHLPSGTALMLYGALGERSQLMTQQGPDFSVERYEEIPNIIRNIMVQLEWNQHHHWAPKVWSRSVTTIQ